MMIQDLVILALNDSWNVDFVPVPYDGYFQTEKHFFVKTELWDFETYELKLILKLFCSELNFSLSPLTLDFNFLTKLQKF